MTCPIRKITLGLAGYPNLILDKTPAGDRLCDRVPADYPNAGDRNARGGLQDKGNLNFPATYEWEPTALLNSAERAIVGRYIAAYKANSSQIWTLQDENEYLDAVEAAGRARTLVPSSSISLSGATLGYYSFNAYLKIESPNFITFQGGDLWLLKGLKFIEVV